MQSPPQQQARLENDAYLRPYLPALQRRAGLAADMERRLTSSGGTLADFASAHEYFGLHRSPDGWVFREWAPNAVSVCLVGDFSAWRESEAYALRLLNAHGEWEVRLPPGALSHGDLYRLRLRWAGGEADRIPAYARRVVQDPETKIFNAQVWAPTPPYAWMHPGFRVPGQPLLIYEAHVGMAQERGGIGSYDEFTDHVIPRIADAGYNAIELMAVLEHPYYASFGYQVSSFFAPSSRFGPPEAFKRLVDTAHERGLAVIIDLVHSHAASNEVEGLSRFDGTLYQYFHEGDRGQHLIWGSRCFDYGKPQVLHFLLSNCRFWLDEYRVDGFRFDGVTSMLYHHHGMGVTFGSYEQYFNESVDEQALTYLTLANRLIHALRPDAITIAEDVSGMPGLAAPLDHGGYGFDYRLAMGVPDCWFKLVAGLPDENWDMGYLWHELTNRRADERTISYAECHDQALVGGKTVMFELADAAIYSAMRVDDNDLRVDRAMALHKIIRLATLATAGSGYLNFMGNEFGHPEWIDFPREGNNWSFHYARRQWSLRDAPNLKYHFLGDFDRAMLALIKERQVLDTTPRLLCIRQDDKVMAFERAGLFFLLNLHPTRSFVDYAIETPPGEYVLEMNTDEGRFGGHARVTPGQRYFTQTVRETDVLRHCLQVYLPNRCALILRRLQRRRAATGSRDTTAE